MSPLAALATASLIVGKFAVAHDVPAAPGVALGDAYNVGSVAAEPALPLRYTFDVVAAIQGTAAGPQLRTSWLWSELLTTADEANELAELWRDAVATLGEAL